MIRLFDLTFSLVGFILLLPMFAILYILGLLDTGSPLFFQERLGKNQRKFRLIKFRTMHIGTTQTGTHMAKSTDISPLGSFLRKSKLDELPQLLNVIKGDMSLVGPRPGLINQIELRNQRAKRHVYDEKPGITGLGQINDIDMSTPRKLSRYDQLMNKKLNMCLYCKLLAATIIGKGRGDRIKTT